MVDTYTKCMLTVIAVALLALVAQNAGQRSFAEATPPVQRVALCDLDGHCSKLASRDGGRGAEYFLSTIDLQPGP